VKTPTLPEYASLVETLCPHSSRGPGRRRSGQPQVPLLRAGYIRQLGAGIYNYLPLGQRSLNKIIAIVREEMDTIGQEFYLPAIHPREVWEQSGRWSVMGDNMFRLKDRKGADLCLGMTHEEIMTSIARNELRSYKQLPQIWYQIQTKFRDEPRPKSGLLRVRQFTMKDSYSFDIDAAGLDKSYDLHDAVYRRIFTRCGLKFVAVEADSGAMGGSQSQEFMVYTDAGEDLIASCPVCGYAANHREGHLAPRARHRDGAHRRRHAGAGSRPAGRHRRCGRVLQDLPSLRHQVRRLHGAQARRGQRQARHLARRRSLPARRPPGQRDQALGALEQQSCAPCRPKSFEVLHGPAGFLGPVGLKPAAKAADDWAHRRRRQILEGRKNLVAGANKLDYHLRNVVPGRDFTWTLAADIRSVNEGEACPTPTMLPAPASSSSAKPSKSATSSSSATSTPSPWARACSTPTARKSRPSWAATASASSAFSPPPSSNPTTRTASGCPASIAPFTVVVTVTNVVRRRARRTGEKLAAELEAAGLDVLLDDRDERAGVKFKDADLVGIPYRINVGKKPPAARWNWSPRHRQPAWMWDRTKSQRN
jgi:prolyl-tRNA synthetase